jgi:hypothetical protein
VIIQPCALCRLPAVVRTVAGEGAWDAARNEYRASYVDPVIPEACPMLAGGQGVCNSGAKRTPEEAIVQWNNRYGKVAAISA